VIIMTAYSDLESAVAAFQGGAFEYLPKPFDVDHAVELVRRALDESRRQVEAVPARGERPRSSARRRRCRRSSAPSAARAIARDGAHHRRIGHRQGAGRARAAPPQPARREAFIAINTAAIPKDLLESELFGHERGAFTGAQAMRRGRFEQAEGGTLFLDEIGDMPQDLQTRLLRVLSDGQFYRVGGHTPLAANVRVIAATHQELEARVKQGLFREDLYHRLNVIRLRLPAMRERREDIAMLAKHFLAKSARDLGVDGKRLTDAALQFFAAQEWPGNVRQLENVCHWVTVMAPGQVVDVKDLPPEVRGETSAAAGDNDWRRVLEREVASRLARGEIGIADSLTRDFETALIVKALQHTGGRRIEAAGLLGIGRNTLTRKVQDLKIDTKD
jgi:two-component system nitrogen regulation response regulator GlnG